MNFSFDIISIVFERLHPYSKGTILARKQVYRKLRSHRCSLCFSYPRVSILSWKWFQQVWCSWIKAVPFCIARHSVLDTGGTGVPQSALAVVPLPSSSVEEKRSQEWRVLSCGTTAVGKIAVCAQWDTRQSLPNPSSVCICLPDKVWNSNILWSQCCFSVY